VRMVTNMGIRSDLIFTGLAIGAVILFNKQIGTALASAGTSAGGAISGGLKAFADSITSAFNFGGPVTTNIAGVGTITGPSEAVVTGTPGGTTVVTVPGTRFVQEIIPSGATPTDPEIPGFDPFKTITDFIDSILNPLPTVGAEEAPSPPPIVTQAPNEQGGTDFSVELFEEGLAGNISGKPILFGDDFTFGPTTSLSEIIDRFNVTASQAANLKFEAGF